jgi:hypothetical protein
MYASTAGRRPRQDLNSALANFVQGGHVATQILPVMGTAEQAFQYAKINNGDAMRIIKTRRAPKAKATRVETAYDYASGYCEERAAEEAVDVTVAARVGGNFEASEVAANTAAATVANDLENDVFSTIFNETNYPVSGTTGLTPGALWTDAASCDPVADVNAVKAFLEAQGTPGNAMVINKLRARTLWNCDRIKNRLTQMYGRVIPGECDVAALSQIFELEVIVAGAMKNTANPGATNAFDYIASSNYCGVFRKSTDMALRDPRLGNIFVWTNAYAKSNADILPVPAQMPSNIMEFARVETYDEPAISSEVVSVKTFTDELLITSNAFKLIKIA